MAADSGMAFVVVLHLSPEHQSELASILQRSTAMPVVQVSELTRVVANHVYVIPPGKHLTILQGILCLTRLERVRASTSPSICSSALWPTVRE